MRPATDAKHREPEWARERLDMALRVLAKMQAVPNAVSIPMGTNPAAKPGLLMSLLPGMGWG